MGVSDGDGGYGFARRGDPVRKKIGRRTAIPGSPAPAQHTDHRHPPAYAQSSAAGSRSPWIWLLIGFLLGTGSTLLTASFWLPESGGQHLAQRDQDERSSADDTTNTEATAAVPDDAEPLPDGAEVAALDLEAQAATPDVERPLPRLSEPDTQPVDRQPAAATPEEEQAVETAEAGNAAEDTLVPSPIQDTDDWVDRPPIDTGQAPESPALLNPEEALAELAAKAAEPSDELIAVLLEDRPDLPASRPSEPADRPAPPAEEAGADDADRPLASQPDEDGAGPPNAPSDTPADEVAADLPPRIREALQAARAEAPAIERAGASRSGRLYRVQLAAVDNEAAARVFWREVNDRLPGVFSEVEPIFDQRTVNQRPFVRIWIGAFDNRGDADGYCGWLKQQGQDCFVTRVDNL